MKNKITVKRGRQTKQKRNIKRGRQTKQRRNIKRKTVRKMKVKSRKKIGGGLSEQKIKEIIDKLQNGSTLEEIVIRNPFINIPVGRYNPKEGVYGNRSRFSSATDEQWKLIVLEAVTKDGMNLKHPAVGKLINDKEVVTAAVENNGMALKYASKDLKNDREVVMAAVGNNGMALDYASKDLKKDIRDGIVSVVKPELILPLDNKEIIPEEPHHLLNIVKSNDAEEAAAREREEKQREVELAADTFLIDNENAHELNELAQPTSIDEFRGKYLNPESSINLRNYEKILKYADKSIKGDRDIMLEVVQNCGVALKYASEKLKKDKEVVKAAIKNDVNAMEYASDNLRKDKDFITDVVTNINGLALGYALTDNDGKNPKDDKDIVMAAVKNNGRALTFATDNLKGNKNVLIAALMGDNYNSISIHNNNDNDTLQWEDILPKGRIQKLEAINYASPDLRGNPYIIKALMKNATYRAMQYASDDLRKNKTFIMDVVTNITGSALQYTLPDRDGDPKDNKEIVLAAVKKNGVALRYVSPRLKKYKEVVKAAIFDTNNDIVNHNVNFLEYASADLKGDKKFMMEVVNKDGSALMWANTDLKGDQGIVLAAVKQNGSAIKHALDNLKNDDDFIMEALKIQPSLMKYAKRDSVFINRNKDFILSIIKNTEKIEDKELIPILDRIVINEEATFKEIKTHIEKHRPNVGLNGKRFYLKN